MALEKPKEAVPGPSWGTQEWGQWMSPNNAKHPPFSWQSKLEDLGKSGHVETRTWASGWTSVSLAGVSDVTEPGRGFDLDEEDSALSLAAPQEVFALPHASSVGGQLSTVHGLPQIVAMKPSRLHTAEEEGFLVGSGRAPLDSVSRDARDVLFTTMAVSLGSCGVEMRWRTGILNFILF